MTPDHKVGAYGDSDVERAWIKYAGDPMDPNTPMELDRFAKHDAFLAGRQSLLDEQKELLQKLATYGTHYGNCPLESWNKSLTKCKCGLFNLLHENGLDRTDLQNSETQQ